MGAVYTDTTWDFRGADTKGYTHCFHSYPAIMIPQIAGELIDRHCSNAKLLFDPYCGSGTSLVEANLRGIDAIGTDLNPLARLLSIAKTTPIDLSRLDKVINRFEELVFNRDFGIEGERPVEAPNFRNIDFWFAPEIQSQLATVRKFIFDISDQHVRNFFMVPFSETVRDASWTRNGEFKLFRMTEKSRSAHNPDVFRLMQTKLRKCRSGLAMYMQEKNGDAISRVFDFNSVDYIPEEIVHPEAVDIVVTSPPYGDSQTTVAYGQFSRLSSQWLGFENAERLDNLLMGGMRNLRKLDFGIDCLDLAIREIRNQDARRVEDVVSFYDDYKRSIDNVSRVVRPQGTVCYVVGNRRVKGVTLPTDLITSQMFELNGFEHIETVVRNIPNKRMPSKNSPTNVVGALDTTMVNEYIVVLKKRG